MSTEFTVEAAARALVGRLAPTEIDQLPMISAGFHHDLAVRRRITTGFDPSAFFATVAPVVVVLLNGVATELITDWAGRGVTGVLGRLRRRRAVRRAIARPAAPQSPLPRLDEERAARVARRCHDIALLSGLTEQQAEIMARLIAEMLMTAPAEHSDAG
jgi:hypothetical protein